MPDRQIVAECTIPGWVPVVIAIGVAGLLACAVLWGW